MHLLSAPAQAASGSVTDLLSFAPLLLLFVVFYFFLIRPQQKKAQQQQQLIAGLRRGDRILTTGGLIGSITKVINDSEIQVEIAEGVRVRVARQLISQVLAKTEPAPEMEDKKPGEGTAAKSASTPKASKPASKAKKTPSASGKTGSKES